MNERVDMDKDKRKRLEAKGWKVESVEDFLGLSKEELEYIELKMTLRKRLLAERKQQKLSQIQLAKKLNTSQSRISKMEKGDPSVSIDLLIRSLISLGLTQEKILR